MSKTLTQCLREYVEGCFTAIWIQTHEPQEAVTEIATLCREQEWQLARWDIDRGLQAGAGGDSGYSETENGADPLAAVKAVGGLANGQPVLTVLENFHRYLSSAEIVQAVVTQVHEGKQTRSITVILSPVVDLPAELEKLFVVMEHQLPTREQLEGIARDIATETGELPDDSKLSDGA